MVFHCHHWRCTARLWPLDGNSNIIYTLSHCHCFNRSTLTTSSAHWQTVCQAVDAENWFSNKAWWLIRALLWAQKSNALKELIKQKEPENIVYLKVILISDIYIWNAKMSGKLKVLQHTLILCSFNVALTVLSTWGQLFCTCVCKNFVSAYVVFFWQSGKKSICIFNFLALIWSPPSSWVEITVRLASDQHFCRCQ